MNFWKIFFGILVEEERIRFFVVVEELQQIFDFNWSTRLQKSSVRSAGTPWLMAMLWAPNGCDYKFESHKNKFVGRDIVCRGVCAHNTYEWKALGRYCGMRSAIAVYASEFVRVLVAHTARLSRSSRESDTNTWTESLWICIHTHGLRWGIKVDISLMQVCADPNFAERDSVNVCVQC